MRLVLQRGWAPGQVRACAGGELPDGRLVGGAAQKLLAVWEERGSEHTLQVLHIDWAFLTTCTISFRQAAVIVVVMDLMSSDSFMVGNSKICCACMT